MKSARVDWMIYLCHCFFMSSSMAGVKKENNLKLNCRRVHKTHVFVAEKQCVKIHKKVLPSHLIIIFPYHSSSYFSLFSSSTCRISTYELLN